MIDGDGWVKYRVETWRKDDRSVDVHVNEDNETVYVTHALLARMMRELGWSKTSPNPPRAMLGDH